MNLFEAETKNLSLVIVHPIGGTRNIAALFEVNGGIVFADVGWNTPGGRHPVHFVEGKVTGEGPWKITGSKDGPSTIRLLRDDEERLAAERKAGNYLVDVP